MTKISRFSTSVVLALNRVRTPIRSKSQYLLSVSRVILRSDKVARVSRAEASAAKHRPQFRHYFIPLDGIRAGRNNKSAPYHGGGRGRQRRRINARLRESPPIPLESRVAARPFERHFFSFAPSPSPPILLLFHGILIPREYLAAERFKLPAEITPKRTSKKLGCTPG